MSGRFHSSLTSEAFRYVSVCRVCSRDFHFQSDNKWFTPNEFEELMFRTEPTNNHFSEETKEDAARFVEIEIIPDDVRRVYTRRCMRA